MDNDCCEIIALGSKPIPTYGQITSADVEYEGLLLGLNNLLHICEHDENFQSEKVIIRGDCKMVIDQMNGVSVPRKQRSYYDEAKLIISKLEGIHNMELNFEHVTRDQNELCDGMCRVLLQQLQYNTIRDIVDLVDAIEENHIEVPLPANKKKRLAFEETQFSKPLNVISQWDGHVPLSVRPYLLCELYHACSRVEDYVAMRLIGETMRAEALRWKKQKIGIDVDILQQLDFIGLKLIYSSLVEMDLKREAEKCRGSILGVYNEDVECIKTKEVQLLQQSLPWINECINDSIKISLNVLQEEKLVKWNEDVVMKISHFAHLECDDKRPWIVFR